MLQDVSSNRLIFDETILHIPNHCKGQTRRKVGTQSHRSKGCGSGHDSGVTRMYNTNDRFYVLRLQMQQHWLGVAQYDANGTFFVAPL